MNCQLPTPEPSACRCGSTDLATPIDLRHVRAHVAELRARQPVEHDIAHVALTLERMSDELQRARADARVALLLVEGRHIISAADTAPCSREFLAELLTHAGAEKREQARRLIDGIAHALWAEANPHACNTINSIGLLCELLPEHDGVGHACVTRWVLLRHGSFLRALHVGNGFLAPYIEPWCYRAPSVERWSCARCEWHGTREECCSRLGKIECPLCLREGYVDLLHPLHPTVRLPSKKRVRVRAAKGARA